MVGNPFTPILALVAMALNLSEISSQDVVAEERRASSSSLSAAAVNGRWGASPRPKEKRRLRRRADRASLIAKSDESKSLGDVRRRRRRLRSKRSGGVPADPAAVSERRADCISRGWHADVVLGGGCSNDDNYPREWVDNPEVEGHMFHSTAKSCCDEFYAGGECLIHDGGCRPEEGGEAEEEAKAAMTTASKPSNQMMAQSKGSSSPLEEAKSAGGPACVWHPSANEGGKCAYSSDYPPGWDDPNWRHMYLFDTHEECCQGGFQLMYCGKEVLCDTPGPTSSPSEEAVWLPPDPTPQPSPAPTANFFIDHFTGVCLDAAEHKQPHYIKKTYPNFNACCEASFARKLCFASDDSRTPAPAPETWAPTYFPTQVFYYVEHFTGVCVDASMKPVPNYIEDHERFTDYRECCEMSLDEEECLAEFASLEPTSRPTDYVPPDPSVFPSSSPSVWPSMETLRPTEDDCSDARWRYESDHVNGCTNFHPSESEGATLFFQSWQECCQAFFAKGWDCHVDNRCRKATEILRFESRTRIDNHCDDSHPKYHPDDAHKDGCTNSLDFPSSWNSMVNQDAIFFSTAIECCENVYLDRGIDCNIRNVCAVIMTEPPTPGPTLPCHDRPWHPDTDIDVDPDAIGCSNSAEYPERWNRIGDMMLFDTAQECCEVWYISSGLECNVHETCPIGEKPSSSDGLNESADDVAQHSSCDPTRWHPSTDAGDTAACSNGVDYPHQWDTPGLSSYMFFDDFLACCEKHFPQSYPSCRRDDECADPTPADAATTPTSPAAASYSCASAKWHPSHDFLKCTNDSDYPLSWEDDSDVVTSTPSQMPSLEPSTKYPTEVPSTEMPTPAPTTKTPTLKPSTNTPTPKPSTNTPTSKPLTKMPTSAPVHLSNTMDDSSPANPCSGKVRGKCKAPLCTWDASQTLCTIGAESRCKGKSRKQCTKVPQCGWSASMNSCADSVNGEGCKGRMYHPRSAEDRTCSNDGNYPELWNEPSVSAKYLHASANRCCVEFYGDGPCNIVNVCSDVGNNDPPQTTAAEEDCGGRKWHPITARDRICTNAEAYPPIWDTPSYSEKYLVSSAEKCCENFYSDGACHKVDACEG